MADQNFDPGGTGGVYNPDGGEMGKVITKETDANLA